MSIKPEPIHTRDRSTVERLSLLAVHAHELELSRPIGGVAGDKEEPLPISRNLWITDGFVREAHYDRFRARSSIVRC